MKIIDCINCNQKLNIPENKHQLKVKCPTCSAKWLWKNESIATITCISCHQVLRIPTDKGNLKVKCPQCNSSWNFETNKSQLGDLGSHSGTAAGAIGSAENFAENVILNAERGHGFAAEKANHLYDKMRLQDAKIVGHDNQKNGADRLVDGVYIQTKYCRTGSKCVSEAFDESGYRYWNTNGTPMQLEVPSDKYEDAIKAMEERIKKGQIKGINDPSKAREIVRKGSFTYEQARNIARFGTIESLTYDAVNGIKLSGTAMGISSAISFAVRIWSGEEWEVALKSACYDGLKTGGIAWISSIITAQAGRTGIEQSLRGTTDWIVKQVGHKASAWIANGVRSGNNIYGAAASNYVSKLLRGNIVTGAITTLVISSVDFARLFNGKISGAQAFKNVTKTAAGVAGGTGGWMGGAAAGAALGSAIPGIGTAIGGVVGGIIGGLAGGATATKATSLLLDEFIEDDANKMLEIVKSVFGELAFDYLLSQNEAEKVIEKFKKIDIPDFLREMHASKNRKEFTAQKFTPWIEEEVKKREKVKLPSEKAIAKYTGLLIEELTEAQPA
ncbi:hypothetical protein [Pseudomonas sp. AN-1]|uniref:hypothetical protein n=1 Tax=Pseudomonas sp. AN-1 TaxID=3096605 RepID=UPI002A6B602D|nr:hypothetical protein [Pseudomonas sp. AN-1]WPP45137.1 hypothetical protein SK095_18100 [Pseudomonas sp. AN-1]